MNKKIFISATVFLVCIPLLGTAAANTTEKKNISYRHEVRVGIGEMFSDIFIRAWSVNERQNIFGIPNLYADYMYHFNHWLSAGLQVNTTWNWRRVTQKRSGRCSWAFLFVWCCCLYAHSTLYLFSYRQEPRGTILGIACRLWCGN